MNTMRVGAEDGKSLVPVDLPGVGWLRLRCDASGSVQSQALGRGGGFLSGLSGGTQMTRIDGDWLEAFDEAMLGFFAIDHADAGMDQCLLECYSDLPAREAALAFGEECELSRVDRFWPRTGLVLSSWIQADEIAPTV